MKLIFILMALPVLASTCKKDKEKDTSAQLKGKVIRTALCAGPIVQVLNNDSMGEDGWKDTRNKDVQYDNVFTVRNACKVSLPGDGTVFYFTIDTTTESGCMNCLAYDGEPITGYNISDISFGK
ncbi:MAG TPA: hypothetical protein VF008_20575 [Niastella sp.]